MSWWHLVPWWLIAAAVLLVVLFLRDVLSSRTAGILALMVALLFGGYRWGAAGADRAWQAKDAKRLQAEADARESELRRGEKASGALQAELLQRAIRNDELTKAFNDYKKHHSIIARPAAACVAAVAGQPGPVQCEPPAGNGSALSLGAVWMWNSALANRDTPAGSCGLADASEGACAADSGVTLEDAWDNQALNARLCADDRLRHQRLIDFLSGRTQ